MAGRPENLKPFKKGEPSGNPDGARRHKGLRKKAKDLTRDELKELGDLILMGKLEKLQAIVDDAKKETGTFRKHSVLKTWVASVAIKAISKGDMHSLDTLLNRLIGPVPKDVKISNPDGSMRPQVYLGLPDNGRDDTGDESDKD